MAVALPLGMILAQPVWTAIALRVGRRALLAIAAGAVLLASAGFLILSAGPLAVVLPLALAYGAASGGIGMALWSAFAGTVARHARGREGWAYGAFTASATCALGVGGLLIGAALQRFDYREQDSEWLVALMTVPSILSAAACLTLLACVPPLSMEGGVQR